MKFKKTKLTALALSVLMAASTITSVTWAADLFTDGAPAEVVVEAPVTDNISVEDAIEPSILTAGAVDINEVIVSGNARNAKGTDDLKDASGSVIKLGFVVNKTGDGYDLKYQFKYKNVDENGNWYTDVETVPATKDESETSLKKATCLEVEMAYYKADVVYGKDSVTVTSSPERLPLPNGKKARHNIDPTHQLVVKAASPCSANSQGTDGRAFVYNGCTICDGLFEKGNDTTPLYDKDALLAMKDDLDTTLNSKGITPVKVDVTHNFDAVYHSDFDNCFWSDEQKKVIGPNDYSKDASYQDYHKCKVCGYTEKVGTKQYVYVVGEREEKVEYEFDVNSNVYGFVYFDTTQKMLKIKETTPNSPATTINATECVDVVLKDCEKPGHLIKKSTSKSGRVTTSTFDVEAHHAWQNAEVETKAINSKTETKEEDLLLDNTNDPSKFAVKRDSNGDVIEAYSINCKKEAKYTLVHQCFNPVCEELKTVKTVTAAKGPHEFGGWFVDETKSTYKELNATKHIKHYMDTRKCSLCSAEETRDSVFNSDVTESHTIGDIEVEGSRVDATCGKDGSYKSGKGCLKCKYMDEATIRTVAIPATDQHDFGTNEPFIEWVGEVQIDKDYRNAADDHYSVYGRIVRKCTVCGLTDSNGVYSLVAGKEIKPGNDNANSNTVKYLKVAHETGVANSLDTIVGKSYGKLVPRATNPATGVAYSCSVAKVPITINWTGTVDGKVWTLSKTKEVPYYLDTITYQGTTAHQPGAVKVEKEVKATPEKEGSYDEVIYCNICNYEISRKTITVPKLDPEIQVGIPVVTATAVNYNTVNISWTPVDGATSYRLYYRSADLGITTWHRVRTLKGTSFTHSGLTTGARYRYTVRAEVDGKLGDYSRTGSVARPLPAAPEMKSVTAVSNGTKVTWSKVDGADGYIIFRKTTGAFTRVGSVSKGSKVTWTDKKPVSGATYKVRAYRTVNNVNYKGAFSAAM